ncbi:hypothetical protein IW262DRAFT_277519 [Armillaria fumosa]|nr:hypothetical protein IW262DRAFT_277519 [Armillaria fumosa]
MAPKRHNIIIQGKIYWKLIGDYDNSENSGSITHKTTVEKTTSYTASTFRQDVSNETKKAIQSWAIKAEAGASYGAVSASVSAEDNSSTEINNLMERTTNSQTEEKQETKSNTEKTFNVGPNSRLVLYQQCFSCAGVVLESDVIRTDSKRGEESTKIVDINVVIEEQEFIKDVKVVYSAQASGQPDGRVLEYSGGKSDINKGFDGKYVSLVPVYTKDIREAAVTFEVIIQHNRDREKGLSDLAEGADGSYRYLVPHKDERNDKKIYELALGRSIQGYTKEHIRSLGYDDSTNDINEGREKDYLYLLWKSKFAYASV